MLQTQFVVVLVHTVTNVIHQDRCDFPQFLNYLAIAYAATLIVLFSNFFYQAYVVTKRHESKPTSDSRYEVTSGNAPELSMMPNGGSKEHNGCITESSSSVHEKHDLNTETGLNHAPQLIENGLDHALQSSENGLDRAPQSIRKRQI